LTTDLLKDNEVNTNKSNSEDQGVTCIDNLSPDIIAMLQAFYSRSFKSIKARLADFGGNTEEKIRKALRSFYVGYGHASIGDCGTTTFFIESVSILAAKIIQNSPLYNGQEASTRYIDFKEVGFINPLKLDPWNNLAVSQSLEGIQQKWLDIYVTATEEVFQSLKRQFQIDNADDPTKLNDANADKAIKARAFDICRSLLPAGSRTMLSFHTTLRKANEMASILSVHPLAEMRIIGKKLSAQIKEKYPDAHAPTSEVISKYLEDNAGMFFYDSGFKEDEAGVKLVHEDRLTQAEYEFVKNRPKYTPLPRHIGMKMMFKISYGMDYGSYRDIQRHRNGYLTFPLLTAELGFGEWYHSQLVSNLSIGTYNKLMDAFSSIPTELNMLGVDEYTKQYAIPLGFKVGFNAMWGLDQMLYLAELRTGATVHPTAREFALDIVKALDENQIFAHVTRDEDVGVSIRRGSQDIVEIKHK
jgi:thymidylate synthase ThyX